MRRRTESKSPRRSACGITAFLAVILLVTGVLSPVYTAGEQSAVAGAEQLILAIHSHDYSRAVGWTYRRVIEGMGGVEPAKNALADAFARQEAQGLKSLSFNLVPTPRYGSVGLNRFCLLPMKITIERNGETLERDSYLLGVSEDGGSTWRYIDGTGIKDESVFTRWFPGGLGGLMLPIVR